MMKQKAQSLYVAPYGASYASIFDETDKEHRRYKLTTTFIDDGIQVTSAREVTPFTDVVQAFNDYVDAKNNALNSISSIDSVELDPEGNVENLARSAFGISTYTLDDCKANEVSSDTKTAHDYVSSSSNRRVLFYKLMNMLDSHTGGTIAEAALKYGAVLNKLYQSD